MKISSKKAFFDYQLFDKLEVGVALTGSEVKSLFAGHASLDEAYIKKIDGQLCLVNAQIHPYQYADVSKIDPKRTRKLLLHKKELLVLESKMQQKNLTLVPVAWYNIGRKIKLEIALAKGKKIWEKKEAIKKKDIERQIEIDIQSDRAKE